MLECASDHLYILNGELQTYIIFYENSSLPEKALMYSPPAAVITVLFFIFGDHIE
jgi:hypothetical protein